MDVDFPRRGTVRKRLIKSERKSAIIGRDGVIERTGDVSLVQVCQGFPASTVKLA